MTVGPRANPMRHPHARRVVACALGLALMVLLGSMERDACDAPTIIVIGDTDKHLEEAAAGVRDALDVRSTVVVLDRFRAECAITPGHGYVGVGPAAASYLALNAPGDVGVSFCMLPSTERAGIDGRRGLVGVTTTVAASDQLELIRRTLPGCQRIGVLHRSGSGTSREAVADLRAAASGRFTIVAVDLDAQESVAAGIDRLIGEHPSVIWTFADPAVFDAASVRALLIASIRAKTPVFGFSAGVVRAGALFGIDIDPRAQGQQLAEMLNAGASVGTRVERAELRPVVNLIVAEQLGVKIPEQVRSQAVQAFR